MERYDFAEPHDISIDLLFPTQDEIDTGLAGGDGPGVEVEGGFELGDLFTPSGGAYTSRNIREENGERIQGLDYGEETPSDLDDIKPEPKMASRDIDYRDEPLYDYEYPGYTLGEPDIDEDTEFSFSYPGRVTGGSDPSYTVDVYKFGLEGETTSVPVTRIGVGDSISAGTWVVVVYNRWIWGSETRSEYIMQVTDGKGNVYPGRIISGSDGLYSVSIYTDGLSGLATTVGVKQLQIASGVTIPSGTWALVSKQTIDTSESGPANYIDEYTMQVPIWL